MGQKLKAKRVEEIRQKKFRTLRGSNTYMTCIFKILNDLLILLSFYITCIYYFNLETKQISPGQICKKFTVHYLSTYFAKLTSI